MKRLLGIVALIGVALVASSCEIPPPAATVGSATVSQSSLDSDIATWTSPKSQVAAGCLMSAVSKTAATDIGEAAGGVGPGALTVPIGLTTTILEYQVGIAVQQNALETRHAKVTAADMADAKTDLETVIGSSCSAEGYSSGSALLSTPDLPSGFVHEVIELQALHEAVERVFGGADFSGSGLQAFYNSNPADFTQVCLSALAFPSEAQAQAIRADIVAGTGGATFASEAEQYPASPEGQSQGGAIGCGALGLIAENDPQLLGPIKALTGLDQVGQPFSLLESSGEVWVLLEATSQSLEPFDPSTVRLDMLTQTQAVYNSWLGAKLASSHVRLNPRYGSWSVEDGQAALLAPTEPPGGLILNPAANGDETATAGAQASTP